MSVLLIRADADERMGTGHVMRTLALAQTWQQIGGEVHYAMVSPPPKIASRLREESVAIDVVHALPGSDDDAKMTIRLAKQYEAGWLVVDGYQFNGNYQRVVKAAKLRLLFFDDYGEAGPYCADIVLNQNLHAAPSFYSQKEPQTRLLLGTRYTLFRKEFWPWRKWERNTPSVARKALVTMGGGNATKSILQAVAALQLAAIPDLEVLVVVGGVNPWYDRLRAEVAKISIHAQLEQNVSDMASRMAWAEIAVSAGGSTSWELAFMGLPSVVVPLSQGEEKVADSLVKCGICATMGWRESLDRAEFAATFRSLANDSQRRSRITSAGRNLVDGLGGERVLSVMESAACA